MYSLNYGSVLCTRIQRCIITLSWRKAAVQLIFLGTGNIVYSMYLRGWQVALSQGDHCLARIADLKINSYNNTQQERKKLTPYGEAKNDCMEEWMCELVW